MKIAIDLGIETPGFIPSIPTFKNEIKSTFNTASEIFEKAFRAVDSDPNEAIGLANSALESIILEILKDSRVGVEYKKNATIKELVTNLVKFFKSDPEFPSECKPLVNSFTTIATEIENLRSNHTFSHGQTDEDYIVRDAIYSSFVVNSISTVGLFILNYYKDRFPKVVGEGVEEIDDDTLPF